MDGHPSDVHPLTPSHGWIPMVSGFGVANTWVSKHQTHDFQAKKQGKKPVSIGWNCRLKHVETCWNWCFQICSKCWCIDSYTDFRQDGQDGHNPSLAPIGYLESLVEKCRKHGGERWDSAILQESKSFNSSVAVFYSLPKQALGPSTSRNGRRLRCCSCCSIAVYLSESDGRIKVKYDSPILPKQHPAVRRKILHSQIPGSEQLGQIAHSHQRPPCNDIWDRRGKFMLREVVDGSKGLVFLTWMTTWLRLNMVNLNTLMRSNECCLILYVLHWSESMSDAVLDHDHAVSCHHEGTFT